MDIYGNGTFKTTLFDIHFSFLLQIETFISSKFLFLMKLHMHQRHSHVCHGTSYIVGMVRCLDCLGWKFKRHSINEKQNIKNREKMVD
jgi:hypothetical protein